MNDRKKFILIALVSLVTGICLIYVFYANHNTVPPLTDADLCQSVGVSFEDKINACGRVIKKAKTNYELLEKQIQNESKIASGARAEIIKARDAFYSKSLSGLDINF
jgi:hypothetical protein